MVKKRKSYEDIIGGSQGWKTVDVGGDFLLGSEEYGFAGLEELDPKELGEGFVWGGEELDTHGDGDDGGKKKAAKGSNKRKQQQTEGQAEGAGKRGTEGTSVDALKAELALLRKENAKLKSERTPPAKKAKKGDEAALSAVAAAATAAARANAPGGGEAEKETKGKKRDAKGKEKAAAELKGSKAKAKAPGRQHQRVDVRAWYPFRLHKTILGALSGLGFGAPTHIQAECIPAAVRDRRDIIGAAQTVSRLGGMCVCVCVEGCWGLCPTCLSTST
jgi:hypothetical protein